MFFFIIFTILIHRSVCSLLCSLRNLTMPNWWSIRQVYVTSALLRFKVFTFQILLKSFVLVRETLDFLNILLVLCLFRPVLLIFSSRMFLKFLHVKTIFQFAKRFLNFRIILLVNQKLFILRQRCVNIFQNFMVMIVVFHTVKIIWGVRIIMMKSWGTAHFVHECRLLKIPTTEVFQHSF